LIRDQGPVSPADAVNYTIQIAGALNHTHAASVVHRDIKPSNIIIMPSGRAKLVDLGLARKQNSDSAHDLTLAGTTLGTFDYISPEQAKDPRSVDVRSDIYSLGCTLYHALTGMPPYPEGTVLQKLLDHQGKEAPDPSQKNPRIPRDLSTICQKMMASDPKQRYATPDVLLRDLMPIAHRMGLRGLPVDGLIWRHVTPPKETFWQKNFGWVASAAALFLIVFVIWRFPDLGRGGSQNTLANADSQLGSKFSTTADDARSVDLKPPFKTPNSTVPSPSTNGAGSSGSTGTKPSGNAIAEIPPRNIAKVLSPEENSGSIKFPFVPSILEEGNDDPPGNIVSQENDNTARPMPMETLIGETDPETQTTTSQETPTPKPPMTLTETGIRPYWIIKNDGSEAEGKFTLEAACTQAADGQIVEIRYNGLLPDALSKPIRIKNKSLIIRAGENYRPLLVFSGVETPADGLLTRLFHLTNASVDLINLDFTLTPKPGTVSDDAWSLVSLEGSGRILLQGVTVTAEDTDRDLTAVVELLPAPVSQMAKDMKMMNMETEGYEATFEVKIYRSFIRGNCNVFQSRHTLPGRLEVEQSAIAVEGSLLRAEGDLDMRDDSDHVELTLNHATCIVGNSLLRMDSGDTPRDLLPVHVRNTRDNLFATATSSNPLVSLSGRSDLDTFQHLLRWDGLNNFYTGFEVFWTVSASEFVPRKFEAWVAEWKRSPDTRDEGARNGGVIWLGEWDRVEPLSEILASDLALSRNPANLALDSAADRTNAGADLTQLPNLPARPVDEP
jgi:serine/threonine-protein kinase